MLNKIKYKQNYCSSIESSLLNECELNGVALQFDILDNNYLIFSGKYGDQIYSNGSICIRIANTTVELKSKLETVFSIVNINERIELCSELYLLKSDRHKHIIHIQN